MCVLKSKESPGTRPTATTKHHDVCRFETLTSSRYRRQKLQNKFMTHGKEFMQPGSLYLVGDSAREDTPMEDVDAKLAELEKRTTALTIVYDDLLGRAEELEAKARKCEVEYSREKTSFDVIEILMRQDGRSKAMFDHVSLFFFVLLRKLHRKGIHLSSTTELWAKLEDENVKRAYQNTVTNLGFSDSEIMSLNLILDVLHEKDLTIYVNQDNVDTNNLTTKLKDFNQEFSVDNPESDGETEDNGALGDQNTQNENCQSCLENESSGVSYTHDIGFGCCEGKDISKSKSKFVGDFDSGSGDTYSVDSLLLYLQIQRELDPLVTSALRRAVAVAHCSLDKKSMDEICDTSTANDESNTKSRIDNNNMDDLEGDVQSIVKRCPESMMPETAECSDSKIDKVFEDNRPEGCGAPFFFDFTTSTPKTTTDKDSDFNKSNNAVVQNLYRAFDMDKECLETEQRNRPKKSTKAKRERDRKESLCRTNLEVKGRDNPLVDDISQEEQSLAYLETLIASQMPCSVDNDGNNIKSFRSFFRNRVRQKTAELVQKERNTIKSRIFKNSKASNNNKPNSAKSKLDENNQNKKNICEIYEVEGLSDYENISESECTSGDGSLFQFQSDTSSCLHGTDDGQSISLHEELSELDFFRCSSSNSCMGTDIVCDPENVNEKRDATLNFANESSTIEREHINFFSSPSSVNPYGYDFEADYYMLWPGQEVEIEMKDLSCELLLDDADTNELDNHKGFDDPGHSFEGSFLEEITLPGTNSKYDSWLLL
ncbi:uncharacterized protein LOC126822288 [Patella vulgata]|uniref:uncharacterized protein LOC126822288 n=1 Tax=Patella vulgata TaxID=6465 RepID=UPI0024A983EB|nr:uncharacterized protein LOC126822288 [Patella vulgata]XP_050407037.2 uncharacterized protein LOC126822288 [Patella vulgata]XP_050407038.2 uncharacterized protein LOC126822288 [Patella vulgata]